MVACTTIIGGSRRKRNAARTLHSARRCNTFAPGRYHLLAQDGIVNAIDFYYFSGTGNTLLVVQKMRDVFAQSGIAVRLLPIEASRPELANLNHTLGLGFPVAAQSTYKFVWDFIRALPKGHGTEAFMVDTMAAFSGGMVGPLKRILKRKGYRPLAAREIIMPTNFLPRNIDEEKNARKVELGLAEAEQFARDILAGTVWWPRVPVLSDAMWWVSTRRLTWAMLAHLGSKFEVDADKCVRCQLCMKLCPVGNVRMDDLPEFLGRCQQCMRCIAFCPKQAIQIPGKKYTPYRAVKARALLPKDPSAD